MPRGRAKLVLLAGEIGRFSEKTQTVNRVLKRAKTRARQSWARWVHLGLRRCEGIRVVFARPVGGLMATFLAVLMFWGTSAVRVLDRGEWATYELFSGLV